MARCALCACTVMRVWKIRPPRRREGDWTCSEAKPALAWLVFGMLAEDVRQREQVPRSRRATRKVRRTGVVRAAAVEPEVRARGRVPQARGWHRMGSCPESAPFRPHAFQCPPARVLRGVPDTSNGGRGCPPWRRARIEACSSVRAHQGLAEGAGPLRGHGRGDRRAHGQQGARASRRVADGVEDLD